MMDHGYTMGEVCMPLGTDRGRRVVRGDAFVSLCCQDLKSCDPHIKTIFVSGESFKIAQMRTCSVSIIKSFQVVIVWTS